MNLRDFLSDCRVLPVVTADSVDSTVMLAQTLADAGMVAVEITLRTDAALDAIAAVREAVPSLTIGSGTICNGSDLERAVRAGASFHVSPGITPELLQAAADAQAILLPGVASASDVMLGLNYGLDTFKLFPATAVGGINMLKSLGGPFPEVAFCPTGGLTADNFRDFLALPNVLCCGGSWMVSSALVQQKQWDMIRTLAKQAMTD